MKILKLARAELKKIFLRPIMVFVFFTLVIAMTFLTLNYNPISRQNTTLKFTGLNVQAVFNEFLIDGNADSKTKLDLILTNEKIRIEDFITQIQSEDQLETLTQKITLAETSINPQLSNLILAYYKPVPEASVAQVTSAFANVRTRALDVVNYLNFDIRENLTFFITKSDYDTLMSFFKKISDNLSTLNFTSPQEQFSSTYNFLSENFNFGSLAPIISKIEPLAITSQNYSGTLEKYYNEILDPNDLYNTDAKLNVLYQEILDFVALKGESTDEDDINMLNGYLSQYKSIIYMSKDILTNSFELAKAGNKTDAEIRNYIGFETYDRYSKKQVVTLSTYLVDNNLFDYAYLYAFNNTQTSGTSINAFDFTVYSMQILSVVIALFSMFIASGTIANEQSSGTMKMIAIRPYSRTKIVTAKLLSCIYLSFILLCIAFASSFAVGYISYGIEQTQVLTVFNAETILSISAFQLLGVYFASLFVNFIFFITITVMFSVLAKSNTFALILSVIIYMTGLFGGIMFNATTWYFMFPTAQLDLYKYFLTSSQNGLFGFAVPLGANFYSSVIYIGVVVFVCYLISTIIFKKRNIA